MYVCLVAPIYTATVINRFLDAKLISTVIGDRKQWRMSLGVKTD